MKAAIVTIGNEILLGKTLNTNMAWLSAELAALGIPVEYAVVVKDDPAAIDNALKDIWDKYEVVISTGGLGPTEDDLTKKCIADFFGKQLHFEETVWQHVQNLFTARGMAVPEINRCQAMVPDGFSALHNARGTAPGLHYQESGRHFFALQGVPVEMKYVFDGSIKGILRQHFPLAKPIYQRTIHTHGISESRLAELYMQSDLPQSVSLAWLPQTGRVDLRFYGIDQSAINEGMESAMKAVTDYVWGIDNDEPAGVLLSLLKHNKRSLAVAESCTGGWIQKLLTAVPGASESYVGGVVSYTNGMKQNTLGVKPETLAVHGAVSAQCVAEMAEGIKLLTNSSHAIAVSGIAGPSGGTEYKPIGTMYFGFIADDEIWTSKQYFNGERDSIRFKASEFAILSMIKHLQGRNN